MVRGKDGRYQSVRGAHGVGKVLGKNKWVHVSGIKELTQTERDLITKAENALRNEKATAIDFTKDVIVRVNPVEKDGAVTFCYSPDWNVTTEPECGLMIGVKGLNSDVHQFRVTKPAKVPYIYHHKWMFVTDEYTGFDVREAKRWSETWENHPVVRALMDDKTEYFRLSIGKKDYWQANVLEPIANNPMDE